jgi:hypothetical protein
MRKYLFSTAKFDELQHKRWRVIAIPKENLRGLIRGATFRERGLVPGPARSMLRRTRFRLLSIYRSRFGEDPFYRERVISRLGPPARKSWLANGYAKWRSRYES